MMPRGTLRQAQGGATLWPPGAPRSSSKTAGQRLGLRGSCSAAGQRLGSARRGADSGAAAALPRDGGRRRGRGA